MQKIKMVVTLR